MKNSNDIYLADLRRYGGYRSWTTRYLFWFRKAQTSASPIFKKIATVMSSLYAHIHGLEIPRLTKIGKGLYLGHPYNITINENATIGENCNIHKGVTIGQTNRGDRKGVPTIGNKVWIGINAVVVGRITVGDDVMIAPNAYVNVDIPPHSIVIGNPCIIKHRDNATEKYIEMEA